MELNHHALIQLNGVITWTVKLHSFSREELRKNKIFFLAGSMNMTELYGAVCVLPCQTLQVDVFLVILSLPARLFLVAM